MRTLVVMTSLMAGALNAQPSATMVAVPAGTYRPLYGHAGDAPTAVATFSIDRRAVTRAEFQSFVVREPQWRRDRVRRVFAETGYLQDWTTAESPSGSLVELEQPVVNVSWFAARAYCAARGQRLPTVSEWEYVGAANATERDASRNPDFIATLMRWYTTRDLRRSSVPNAYGIDGLHGATWEWTEDFNSVIVADDSRNSGSGGDGRDHDLFCASATLGALDPTNYPAFMRYAVRAGLTGRATIGALGFRCAGPA